MSQSITEVRKAKRIVIILRALIGLAYLAVAAYVAIYVFGIQVWVILGDGFLGNEFLGNEFTLQKSSRVIRGMSDGLSASYPEIRSTDPNSQTCDAEAPNRMAKSLILSANSFDDVTMTDWEENRIEVCGSSRMVRSMIRMRCQENQDSWVSALWDHDDVKSAIWTPMM